MKKKTDPIIAASYPKYALLSVSNKTGIENLGRALSDFGYKIIADRETSEALSASGVPVVTVDRLLFYAAFLDNNGDIDYISSFSFDLPKEIKQDMVNAVKLQTSIINIIVCNLDSVKNNMFHSEKDLVETAAKVDICKTALLKAAAKNFNLVTTVCNSDFYEDLLWHLASCGETPYETRFEWAKSALEHVCQYDRVVFETISKYNLSATDRM